MFVPGKPFQPSVMFASKAGVYPCEGALLSGLTLKHQTKLERPGRDKHTSLKQTLVITVVKSFKTCGCSGSFNRDNYDSGRRIKSILSDKKNDLITVRGNDALPFFVSLVPRHSTERHSA